MTGRSPESKVPYRRVIPQGAWTGETARAVRRRGGAEGLLVMQYLMTSPYSNYLGVFRQVIGYMGAETGLGEIGATKGLQACIDAGFCAYDPDSEFVWVFEMAKWQIAEELKTSDNRMKGVQKAYSILPENPFLRVFFDRYAAAFGLVEPRDPRTAIDGPRDMFGMLIGGENRSPFVARKQVAVAGSSSNQQAAEDTGDARAGPGETPTPPPPPRVDPPPPAPEPPPAPRVVDGFVPTAAGAACLALRQAGIPDASTTHPKLLALLAAGATPQELTEAAADAIAAGKGNFRYVLGIVVGRRADAEALQVASGAPPPRGGHRNRQEALEASNRAVGDAWVAKHRKPAKEPAE